MSMDFVSSAARAAGDQPAKVRLSRKLRNCRVVHSSIRRWSSFNGGALVAAAEVWAKAQSAVQMRNTATAESQARPTEGQSLFMRAIVRKLDVARPRSKIILPIYE